MLRIEEFREYLLRINFGSVDSYISYLNRLIPILNEYEIYANLNDDDKIKKFANEDNEFKTIFDTLDKYKSERTFSNLRSGSRKYVEFLNIDIVIPEPIGEIIQSNIEIKNIMLYGAPGVGKTHNYKKLISMIEEDKQSQHEIFTTISNNEITINEYDDTFQTIKNEKRIEFVTFHQSYSYEDFIEGFRPNESGNIELEDGIFKVISDNAEENLQHSKLNTNTKSLDIIELIKKFTNSVQDSLDKNEAFSLGDKILIDSISDRGSFLLGGSIKNDTQRLTIDMIIRDYENYKNGYIRSYEDVKPKFESKRNFHGNARYYFMLYKKMGEYEKTLQINTIELKKEEEKNFYIVIDEINRGNISKIFGELITLIEEDKRYDGNKIDYEVTLPYCKEKFKIPSNLYIIATMNSTDKSIATIDIALRRRFTFLKMEPNIELVPDIAKELFINLNKYISDNLNKDFQLGHSYFMKARDEDALKFIKKYKLKPLLEEYFYADDEKLNLVLDILKINITI